MVSAMKTICSLRNIEVCRSKSFKLRIDRLDLIDRGVYALTGANGSGKSTLLNIMALLIHPDQGGMRFAGAPIQPYRPFLKELRRQITLVDQSPYLFDDSIYNNLAFGLRIRGIRGQEQRLRIAEALESVGLSGFEQRQSRELSGGQIQRAALARALTLRPKLLLLDEPTSNSDHAHLDAFEQLITSLPEQGITVVFSTHDLDQPRRLGAKMIQLNEGRLVEAPGLVAEPPLVKKTEKEIWPKPLKMPEPSF